jgi:hypothetical protein
VTYCPSWDPSDRRLFAARFRPSLRGAQSWPPRRLSGRRQRDETGQARPPATAPQLRFSQFVYYKSFDVLVPNDQSTPTITSPADIAHRDTWTMTFTPRPPPAPFHLALPPDRLTIATSLRTTPHNSQSPLGSSLRTGSRGSAAGALRSRET